VTGTPRWRGIVTGGLVAGTFDILFAFTQAWLRGRGPGRVLQTIASGLLGKASFEGGVGTMALGLFLHFVIALGAAATYAIASRRLRVLVTRAVPCGLAFGVGVYVFMNFVVLPLSAFPLKVTYPLRALIPGLLIHMLGIGLPIALLNRRYDARRAS
jgi:hypothetical protein